MSFNSYTIHHLELSTDHLPLPEADGGAHYVIFWYTHIPLGHSFLTAGQMSDADLLSREAFKAIAPALGYYDPAFNYLEDPFVPENFLALKKLCENIFKPYKRLAIPTETDVSVIICTRNRPASLQNCLKALMIQDFRPLEVIVVDNAPTNDETRKVAEQFPFVRYVREDRPGLDIARNTGVRNASGSIVAFTDDDTIPDVSWVLSIAQAFEEKDIVAMTGLVIAGALQNEAEIIFEKFWPFNRGYVPRLYDKKFFNTTLANGPPVWEIGAGANMAFRKTIFDEVGYFDERLDVGAAGCSGDSELWYRILANGFGIFYNPRAVVKHFHRSSVPELKSQLYAYMKGFTVAILIQHQRFGHKGNLHHLFRTLPLYYLHLLSKGFPGYRFQYQTLFEEMRGVLAGMIYYLRHRNTNPGIYYDNDQL